MQALRADGEEKDSTYLLLGFGWTSVEALLPPFFGAGLPTRAAWPPCAPL